jgi:hypothetical protein
MRRLLAQLPRILVDPWVLYHAQFTNPARPMVLVSRIGAGPLMTVTSGQGPQVPLEQPAGDGVLFA